jgi:hypothetical protein
LEKAFNRRSADGKADGVLMNKKAGMTVAMQTLMLFSFLMAAPGLKVTVTTVDPSGGTWVTKY